MRIGLVVDSGCDLPRAFLDENRIAILPIAITKVGLQKQTLIDNRDVDVTLEFYRQHAASAGDAETAPLTVEQIKELFLDKIVLDYDYVFCLTIASSRSPIFENATKASLAILANYKPVRAKAGVTGPFTLRVIDTQNLFAAQGITAVEAVRLLKSGQDNANKIRERLEFLIQNTYGYMLPRDLFHLRTRAQKKGDRSVGLVGALFGSALDIKPLVRGYRNVTEPVAKLRGFDEGARRLFEYVVRRVQAGLLTPTVCVSYGGPLDNLRKLPGYGDLIGVCKARQVEVFESLMSITGGINVGEGAVAIAFASEPHELDV